MYYLYIRDGVKDGVGYFRLAGIFVPSTYWSNSCNLALEIYGAKNVTYRFHPIYS